MRPILRTHCRLVQMNREESVRYRSGRRSLLFLGLSTAK